LLLDALLQALASTKRQTRTVSEFDIRGRYNEAVSSPKPPRAPLEAHDGIARAHQCRARVIGARARQREFVDADLRIVTPPSGFGRTCRASSIALCTAVVVADLELDQASLLGPFGACTVVVR
jgi:hypothetical protein